ncbi:hypothetical protein HMPREF1576_00291 [Gardnerella pickettii JCP7719]|uniref:Uncharacterized protein n=1 Tax=Gardnerella pickettii JCP7719 TaxID=1261061 RepID=S4GX84_9BIFI|nr:hypothetical protein HMPREF1576_00291 [Gardnerella pickettii JCP7719]
MYLFYVLYFLKLCYAIFRFLDFAIFRFCYAMKVCLYAIC